MLTLTFGTKPLEVYSILMEKDKSLNLKQKDTKLKPWRTLQVIIAIIELLMVMKVPFYLEATWNLKSGDFRYAKFKVTKIEYNNPSKF